VVHENVVGPTGACVVSILIPDGLADAAAHPEGLRLQWGSLQANATAYEATDQARVEFMPGSGQVVRFRLQDEEVVAVEFDGLRFAR
jgi:hypothetical protein